MKQSVTKILLWTISCSFVMLGLLFSVKKAFAAQTDPGTCQTGLPSKSIEPLWESISHQFVSTVAVY